MSNLLHIDASVRGAASVSRQLTARAAERWRTTHPGGTATYRDLAANPIPHLDADNGLALMTPPDQHTPAQARTYALSVELIDEIKAADTVVLGMPLYNFGVPSLIKSWVDHIIVAGLSFSPDGTSLLGDTELIVLESRGGGYSPGTPRHGWDHAETWLPHGLSMTGLQPRIITAELTMATEDDRMAHLQPLAQQSLDNAHALIDALWAADDENAA
ncbi:FMN-dependent NADH-azoreductase [Mycolicibacterium sp. 018/SC-01/001]|uniref:FMN-dependent NADH-azoreductase n=1 Tax=Mycolicibacterium sp. 018/SC-01/001 TaxID=2592069 RepID=UPI00118137F6|nr:NAD(P)H-dependent oxidoreductase [Mycolicibacterium sp. 018/SC-01/001]TRW82087.1 FMN-dependent NADH-azoreductase [Mycolicibacterium sp. 018/SC-01/001]